jgi:hypothetical protein
LKKTPQFRSWQWAILLTLLIVLNMVILGGLYVLVTTYRQWTDPGVVASEPTVPPGSTPTATQRPTFTPTNTPEVWPTATATRTPTITPSPTVTWTPLPTRTAEATRTPRAGDGSASPVSVPAQDMTTAANSADVAHLIPDEEGNSVSDQMETEVPRTTSTPTPVSMATSQVMAAVARAALVTGSDQSLALSSISSSSPEVHLSWVAASPMKTYRVYSDMGSGYGVYVFQIETEDTSLLQRKARSGYRYAYQIESIDLAGTVSRTQALVVAGGQPLEIMVGESLSPSP